MAFLVIFDDLLLLHRRAKIPQLCPGKVAMTASFLTWRQCWILVRFLLKTSMPAVWTDTAKKKKFQIWTLGASYHNSCSMMVLNESRITTASWDFLCLCFERRLSKEFGLAKHDCASSLPLVSEQQFLLWVIISASVIFLQHKIVEKFHTAQTSDLGSITRRMMSESIRNRATIRKYTTKNAPSKDQAESISPVWKSANLAKPVFLRGP